MELSSTKVYTTKGSINMSISQRLGFAAFHLQVAQITRVSLLLETIPTRGVYTPEGHWERALKVVSSVLLLMIELTLECPGQMAIDLPLDISNEDKHTGLGKQEALNECSLKQYFQSGNL